LGAYGEIESDQTVVMRVRFPDSIEEPQLLPNLRWRGLAFDRFDGRVWEAGPRQRVLLRREPSGEFALAAPHGSGPIVRQEIFLDPIGADAVFVAPRGFGAPPVPRPGAGGARGAQGRLGQRRPPRRADAPAVRRGFRARAHAAPRSPARRVAGGDDPAKPRPLPPASTRGAAHQRPRARGDGGQPQSLRGGPPPHPVPVVRAL